MSLLQVKRAVENFVENTENDSLLIKGDWGSGKTYFWNDVITKVSRKGQIGHQNYGYISLFGIDSFETLKNSIIAAQIISSAVGKDSSTSVSNLFSQIKTFAQFVEKTPKIRAYTEGWASEIAFKTVKDSLICFDDLERKSDKLDIKDILGLASLLKEQRNCKVVFISNNEKILDKGKESFDQHSEKLIDVELDFSPLPEEAFEFIFRESDSFYNLIKICCLKLKIKNLRILQRIKRFVRYLSPILIGVEESVQKEVIKSTVLFIWAYYNRDKNSISLEALKNLSVFGFYMNKYSNPNKISEKDEKTIDFLSDYGWNSFSLIDENLAFYIEKGYLKENDFLDCLAKKIKEVQLGNAGRSFSKVFRLYDDSFDDNETDFVENLIDSFNENVEALDTNDLNYTVGILRKLDKNNQANKLIDNYIEFHKNHFTDNFIETVVYRHIQDPYIREKISQLNQKHKNEFDIEKVVLRMHRNESSYEDIEFLASCEISSFYEFFKAKNSVEKYYLIKVCLQYENLPAESVHKQITTKAVKALKLIGNESRFNKMRVENIYKIKVDDVSINAKDNNEN